jgi:hypothetical protein
VVVWSRQKIEKVEEEAPMQQLSSSFKLLQYRKTVVDGTKTLSFDVDLG